MGRNSKGICMVVMMLASTLCGADELADREEIMKTGGELVQTGEFAKFEEIAHQYRTDEEKTASGVWKLDFHYLGVRRLFDDLARNESAMQDLGAKVAQFASSHPESASTCVLNGIYLVTKAWHIRGTKLAKDVPDWAWKPFKDGLKIATEELNSCKKVGAKDPYWYVMNMAALRGLTDNQFTHDALLREGYTRYPYYPELYSVAVEGMTPKWGGDKNLIEDFANDVVDRTKDRMGMQMYTRIYWNAHHFQYQDRLFSDSAVSWPKMKQGIRDLLEAYPTQWNIQFMAFFACKVRDREMTHELFEKIDTPPIPEAWKMKMNFSYCESFANINEGESL